MVLCDRLGYCEDWVLLSAQVVLAEITLPVSSLLGLAHGKTSLFS